MMAFRNKDDIVVVRNDDLVEPPVIRIDALDGKPFGFVDLIKIYLFQIRLEEGAPAVDGMRIMLVGRIKIQFPQVEDLHRDKSMTIEARRQRAVDLPCRVARSPDLDTHLLRCHKPRRMILIGRTPGKSK